MASRRKPSIHIYGTDLKRILKRLIEGDRMSLCDDSLDDLVEDILRMGKSLRINHRLILASTQKTRKRASQIVNNSEQATMFAQLLNMYRVKARHRNIKKITEGSSEWRTLRDVSVNANTFCNDNDLKTREGFIAYIDIGFKLMKNFSINRFIGLHDVIGRYWQAQNIIIKDPNTKETRNAYEIYNEIVANKTGIALDYLNDPTKYVYFVLMTGDALEIGVTTKDYLKAQFSAFEYNNMIPEPIQLVGDKAINRVTKYLFKNNITIKNNIGVDFSRIKKLGKN